MNDQEKKIIIATGGTGGHIFPAVSLANYLIKTGFNLTLTTDKRGFKFIDDKLLSNTKTINSTPLDNNKKITSIFKILLAVFKSIIFLIKTKPKLIFGMGGYASFPLCFAGIILRIPFIVYENNLAIGKTNRYLLPFAKKFLFLMKILKELTKNIKIKL